MKSNFTGLYLRVAFDVDFLNKLPKPVLIKWLAETAPNNQHLHTALHLQPRRDYIQDSYVHWARDQILECEGHSHQLADNSFCPERLLDVHGERLCLVTREQAFRPLVQQVPKYAALSYCWGSTDDACAQITLSRGNLDRYRFGIQYDSLPLSVQDAVAMARALSLRYLWVDALCILQDDPSDWERQCVDMHKIYGNAFVTLCAASSRSCRQGFLRPDPGYRVSMPYQSSSLSGQYCLRLRGVEPHHTATKNPGIRFVDNATRYADFNTDSLWAKRGWVFQERASSLRSIVFGKQNLHFVCSKITRTKDAPYDDFDSETWQRDDTVFIFRRPKDLAQSEALDKWLELIQSYSRIQPESFTDKSDFLPAISGLAGLYHQYLKRSKGDDVFLEPTKDYTAGYWRQDIPRSILWHLVNNPTTAPTLPEYINSLHHQSHQLHLPSWSQISRGYTHSILNNKHCGIYRTPLGFQPKMEILNTHTAPLGKKNPFGAIQPNPHLHIRTKILNFATTSRAFSIRPPTLLLHRPHVSTEFELCYNLHTLCLVTLDFAPNNNNNNNNNNNHHPNDHQETPSSSDLLRHCQLALVGQHNDTEALGLVLYPILPPPPLSRPPSTPGVVAPSQHQHFYRAGVFSGPGLGVMSNLFTDTTCFDLFESLAEEKEIFLY
ncbi:heterokaryon incompatibility protein-domain-containing protein [Cercophora samala]|uniref:Heterokaryon incompatibility protein-domain-containing protein n=1 Tax=Cercophora samala TaxID=330535 RepID=A0AA40DEZ6_9PEZI|nr:heterokaryon incompatibility protein-domain-containing protein [Cercophora samala]